MFSSLNVDQKYCNYIIRVSGFQLLPDFFSYVLSFFYSLVSSCIHILVNLSTAGSRINCEHFVRDEDY